MAARARYRASMVAPSRSGFRGAVRRWPGEAISTAPRARAREPVSYPEVPGTTFSDDKVDAFVTMSSAFHQGVGYEHGTDRFRSAQASRANAGSPREHTDGFRSASSLRANAAGSPFEHWVRPRPRAGSTRFSSPRAANASRQPSGGSAGTSRQPLNGDTGTGRQQPGRRFPRLAQEAVWRLSRLRGPFARAADTPCED